MVNVCSDTYIILEFLTNKNTSENSSEKKKIIKLDLNDQSVLV